MTTQNIITGKEIIKSLPGLFAHLPGIIKGARLANIKDKTRPVGLGLCVELAVSANPHGTAIKYEDRAITYSRFNAWANQIAHYLLSRNIQKSDSVAILVENRPELLATVLACAKIGAVSAMLNTSQKGKVLAHSIRLVDPKLLIAGEECVGNYDAIREDIELDADCHLFLADTDTLEDVGSSPDGWKNLAQEIREQPQHNPHETKSIFWEDPCFYLYTSGTTGLPKAVIFNHGRLFRIHGSFGLGAIGLKKQDIVYVPLPFYHGTALTIGWTSALANGACLVMTRKFSVSDRKSVV